MVLRESTEPRGTVLVCHGNVENISTHVKLDFWLVRGGIQSLYFRLSRIWPLEGRADVKGVHLDAEAALETLIKRLQPPGNDRIIVFGRAWAALSPHTWSQLRPVRSA